MLISVAAPQSATALSCLDAASSVELFANNADYIVVTATAGETTEHDQTIDENDEDSLFGQMNVQANGYTGQYIAVSESHQNGMDSQAKVYYQKDSTWGYLCTSNPPAAGTDNVYVLARDNAPFGLTTVVQVYAADTEFATQLLAELEANEATGEVYERTANSWRESLYNDLKQMAFYIKLKLSEWQFWANQ